MTSIFDHCSPNYVPDGVVCRYDGLTKLAGGFDETGPPSQAWLFYDGHDGLDYGLYYENVVAAADGRVVYADWNRPGCATCGYGQEVRIDHGNGITTRYAHLSKILVGDGQQVRRGQVIGISGNTGASTGEHLHFGAYLTAGFIPLDPYGWSVDGADPYHVEAASRLEDAYRKESATDELRRLYREDAPVPHRARKRALLARERGAA